MKAVYLHLIDGYEFEKLIGEIFRLHGYKVMNIQFSGDSGRDLILEREGKRILVECKHQKGTIGRPVIQKLHSAVVVDKKADQGRVITTGKFSKQAFEYVKKQNLPIELIDLPGLRSLAAQVDIELLLKGEKASQKIYPVYKNEITFKNIINMLSKKFKSVPLSLENLFKPFNWSIELLPVYRISYRIDYTCTNTVGDILLDLHKSGICHLNSNNLENIKEDINDYFVDTRAITMSNTNYVLNDIVKPFFKYDVSRVKINVVNYLIRKYKNIVTYVGRNNVKYTRECIPKKRDILIRNIDAVYLPFRITPLNALKRKYYLKILEKENKEPLIIETQLDRCYICNKKLQENGIICNSCGSITHTPGWWRRRSHGYTCDVCGKTICRDCGLWRRKWLFMKHVVCNECAIKERNEGKKLEKIPRLL